MKEPKFQAVIEPKGTSVVVELERTGATYDVNFRNDSSEVINYEVFHSPVYGSITSAAGTGSSTSIAVTATEGLEVGDTVSLINGQGSVVHLALTGVAANSLSFTSSDLSNFPEGSRVVKAVDLNLNSGITVHGDVGGDWTSVDTGSVVGKAEVTYDSSKIDGFLKVVTSGDGYGEMTFNGFGNVTQKEVVG